MIRTCLLRPSPRLLYFRMSSTNASGLTASESKALKERSAQPHEQNIIQSLKEMYSCKPRDSTFDVYTKDAVFHDPVGLAQGRDSVVAQFLGLAKIFPRADIPKFRVLQNPSSVPESTILVDQDVAYFRDAKSDSPTKTINSLLTIETDASHKITRHTEEWNHSKQTTSDDGFLGMLNEQRKKLTASLTDTFVGKQ
jgi:hypothetical protein